MKVLVSFKRVADPDNANKVRVVAGPAGLAPRIETTGLEYKPNPFDEYALEAALRLTENGTNTRQRLGEVVVATFGPAECDATLRGALATGADKAIRVDATDEQLDGETVARGLAKLVELVKPDVVIMGKQTVDSDGAEVGPFLAELLKWPQVTFAVALHNQNDGHLRVGRAADGGIVRLRVKLPAIVTVEDRVVYHGGVVSAPTPATHRYADGVRFAALPAIMAAKKKPLEVKKLADLVGSSAARVKYLGYAPSPARKAGVRVQSVTELVERLKNEAKVL